MRGIKSALPNTARELYAKKIMKYVLYIKINCNFALLKYITETIMQTISTKGSNEIYDNRAMAADDEVKEKYISSKEFFALLRKEVNSHYDNL